MSKRKAKTTTRSPGQAFSQEDFIRHLTQGFAGPKTVIVDLDKYGVTLRDQNITLVVRVAGQNVGNVSMRRA